MVSSTGRRVQGDLGHAVAWARLQLRSVAELPRMEPRGDQDRLTHAAAVVQHAGVTEPPLFRVDRRWPSPSLSLSECPEGQTPRRAVSPP